MAQYDTTATMAEDTFLDELAANTPWNLTYMRIAKNPGARDRALMNFRVPSKPTGADSLDRLSLTLTYRGVGTGGGLEYRTYKMFSVDRLWTEASATWVTYAGTGSTWGLAGGDTGTEVGVLGLVGAYGSSFAFDITALGVSWSDHGSVLLRDAVETGATSSKAFFSTESGATTSWLPHITARFTDNPPAAINDLKLRPDVSLSEASYSFRQRAVLEFGAVDADDFYRYRIRYGVNRSQALNHIHKAFIYSRASTAYLDTTLYTDGSTIYYSIYGEDTRNQSASTNANVSNVVSWTKPQAVSGGANTYAPSVLDLVTFNVRMTDMTKAKKAKIIWGDAPNGVYSFTQTLTSAGGYFTAIHRYSMATTVTPRFIVEDIYGFRSGISSATNIVVANPGPIARLMASPSKHMDKRTYPAWVSDYSPSSYQSAADAVRDYDIHLEVNHPWRAPAYNPVFSPDAPIPDIAVVAAAYLCPCREGPPHTVMTQLGQYEDPARLLAVEHLKITLCQIGGPIAVDAIDRAWFISRVIDDETDPPDVEEGELLDSCYRFEIFHPDCVIDRESFRAFVKSSRKRGVTPTLDRFLAESKKDMAIRIG